MKIDQVIHSKRKTIAIIVKKDGSVIVRAPLRATRAQIMQFINQKAAWIEKSQSEVLARLQSAPGHQYLDGETFYYLGKPYALRVVDHASLALALNGDFTLARKAQPRAKQAFARWYRQQAATILADRTAAFATRFGLSFKQVKITTARTRWGSYSSTGTISYSYRLIMAPLEIVDYVIVHELAHIRHRNHSQAYWKQVSAFMPDYRQRAAWLKANGHLFTLD